MFFELSRNWEIFPARQVRGAEQRSTLAFYPSWGAHVDGSYSRRAPSCHQTIDRTLYGAKSLVGAGVGKHRGASGVQNLAARIHEADGHLRAADINTQYEFVGTSVADAIFQRRISLWRIAPLG